MKATVRYFHSPDAELEIFEPADASNVGLFIQMLIGPADEKGQESFGLFVCTLSWLSSELQDIKLMFGMHSLVVKSWDWPLIKAYLLGKIAEVEGNDWTEVATKIGRFSEWEFQAYGMLGDFRR